LWYNALHSVKAIKMPVNYVVTQISLGHIHCFSLVPAIEGSKPNQLNFRKSWRLRWCKLL